MSDGDKKKRTFKRLSFEERILIQEYWNGQSLTVSEVARRLNRDYTTIWNELRRGVSYDISDVNPKELKFNAHAWIRYSAEVAEYNSKKKNESRSGPLKLTRKMVEVVEHDMNVKFWSPEDVVARHPEIKVSASTIRNYIRKGYIRVDGPYGQKRKRPNHISTSEELKLLKAERERLEKERLAKMNSSEFLQTVSLTRYSIDERPKSVENRRYFGHWEIDLVFSRVGTRKPLMTLVERKTRFSYVVPVESRSGDDIIIGLKKFLAIHGDFVRSITADNGTEFISWKVLDFLQGDNKIKVYFAHPHQPRDRAQNENRNNIIRVFSRENADYGRISADQIQRLLDRINGKPMRLALDGKTPAEAYAIETKRWLRAHRN